MWLRWLIIGLVILALIFGAWYFFAGGGPALRGQRATCNELRTQLAAAQARNDANAIATLQRQLALCVEKQQALGDESADPFGSALADCVSTFDLINPQLSDIIATDRADWLKRGNIWRNALHFATDAQQCLAGLAADATTKEDLTRLRDAVLRYGRAMVQTRIRLYDASHGGEAGLDAYSGSPEPGGDDKAKAWLAGVVNPLWTTLRNIDVKLVPLDPSNRALRTELDILTANPTYFDQTPTVRNSVFGGRGS